FKGSQVSKLKASGFKVSRFRRFQVSSFRRWRQPVRQEGVMLRPFRAEASRVQQGPGSLPLKQNPLEWGTLHAGCPEAVPASASPGCCRGWLNPCFGVGAGAALSIEREGL